MKERVFFKFLSALLFFTAMLGLSSATFAQGAYRTYNVCVGEPVVLSTTATTPNGWYKTSNPALMGTLWAQDKMDVTILVASAADAGWYRLYNNAAGAGVVIDSFQLVVNALPTPVITGPFSVCANDAGVTYSTESTWSSFLWVVSSDGAIDGDDDKDVVTIDWGAATASAFINVTVVDANGCEGSTNEPIVINTLPIPTISGLDTVCANQAGVSYFADAGMTSYFWVVTGGDSVGGVAEEVIIDWGAAGGGTLSVAVVDANGCAGSADTTIVIDALPVPTITGSLDVCETRVTSYSTETGMSDYVWVVTGGTIVGGIDDQYEVSVEWGAAGSGSITVSYKDATGCDGTSVENIVINVLPEPSVISGSDIVCENVVGGVYSVTADPSIVTYDWSIDSESAGTTFSASNNEMTITAWSGAGTHTISVTCYNAEACDSTVTFEVTVLPAPKPTIVGSNYVCENSLETYFTTEADMDEYLWTITNGVASDGILNSDTLRVRWNVGNTSGLLNLYCKNSDGCDTTIEYNVTINLLPVVPAIVSGSSPYLDIAAKKDTVCRNSNYTYTVDFPMDCNCRWAVVDNGGTAKIVGANDQETVEVNWDGQGTKILKLVCENTITGCISDTVKVLDVTVRPTTVNNIAHQFSDFSQLYCPNSDIVIAVTNPQPGFTYEWYGKSLSAGDILWWNGSPFASAGQGDTLIFRSEGSTTTTTMKQLYVRAIDQYGCTSDTSNVIMIMLNKQIKITNIVPNSTCPEKQILITTTIAGGLLPFNHYWNINHIRKVEGDVVVTIDSTRSDLVNPNGGASYSFYGGNCEDSVYVTAWVKDTNGCVSPDTTLVFRIHDSVPADFVFVPSNYRLLKDDACDYDEIHLNITGDSVLWNEATMGAWNGFPGAPIANTECQVNLPRYYRDEVYPLCEGTDSIVRKWTVNSKCGVRADTTQIFIVEDLLPPVLADLEDTTIYRDEYCSYNSDPTVIGSMPTITDNCTTSGFNYLGQITRTRYLNYLLTGIIRPGGPGGMPVQPPYYFYADAHSVDLTLVDSLCNHRITRTWYAKDACGNVDSIKQTITVRDTIRPVLDRATATDRTINTSIACIYILPPEFPFLGIGGSRPTATDNCTPNPTITYTQVREDGEDCAADQIKYIVTRKWVAKDVCGNESDTLYQKFYIKDVMRPARLRETTLPSTLTAYVDKNCDFVNPDTASVQNYFLDNCTPSSRLTLKTFDSDETVGTPGNPYCGRTFIRRWVAVDECNNESRDSLRQTIRLIDTIKPIVTCPPDTFVYDEGGCDGYTLVIDPTYTGVATVVENCDKYSLTYEDAAPIKGPDNCGLIINRTWRAIDSCHNVGTCVQQIEVRDTIKPQFDNIPRDTVIFVQSICPDPDPNDTLVANTGGWATGRDNLNTEVIVEYHTELVVANDNCYWMFKRTWIVADSCGNSDSVVQIIELYDTLAPVFVTPPASPFFVAYADAECAYGTDLDITGKPEAEDNCIDPEDVVITALDSYVSTRSIVDIIANVDGLPLDVLDLVVKWHSVYQMERGHDLYCEVKLYSRDFIATDLCGNADTSGLPYRQYFIVVDTTPPTITIAETSICKDVSLASPYYSTARIHPDVTGYPELWDNCTDMTLATLEADFTALLAVPNSYTYSDDYSHVIPSKIVDGYILRTWYAMDDCGNIDSVVQRINVVSQPIVWFARNKIVCEDADFRTIAKIYPPDVDYTYEWVWWNFDEQTSGPGIASGKPQIVGTNSDTLTMSGLAINNYGYLFRFTAYNLATGCEVQAFDTIHVQTSQTMRIYTDAPFDKGAHTICKNTGVTLTADINFPHELLKNMRYQWYRDGIAMDGEIYPVLVDTIDEQHTYQFIMHQMGGTQCDIYSNFITIAVFEQPQVYISQDFPMICEGGATTLTAHLDNNTLHGLVYQWYKDGDAIKGANTPSYLANEAGKYWIDVVQLLTGCLAITGANDTVDLNIIEKPKIDLSQLDLKPTYCLGSQITLKVGLQYYIAGLDTLGIIYPDEEGSIWDIDTTLAKMLCADSLEFRWYKNGFWMRGAELNHFTDLLTDVGSVTYEVKIKTCAPGCETELDTVWTLEVIDVPKVTIAGHPVICGPDSAMVNLTANAYYNTEDYEYQWFLDNVPLANETDTFYQHKYAANPTPYNFTVEVTDTATGCVVMSDVFAVHISSNPMTYITASANAVCENGSVTLSANIGYDVNNMDYQWYRNGVAEVGMNANSTVYTTTLTKTDTFTFKAVEKGGTGCGINSDTVIVSVITTPIAPLLVDYSDTICEGGEVYLIAKDTTGTFMWYRNGVLIQGADLGWLRDYPPTSHEKHLAKYTYNAVYVANVNGITCASPMSDSAEIVVFKNPSIVIVGDPIVCETGAGDRNVHLQANINDTLYTANSLTYQWRLGNTDIPGATSYKFDTLNVPNTTTAPNMYTVRVATSNGCERLSEPFYVTVYQNPVVFVTATEDTICTSGQVTLTANLDNYNNPNLTYAWTSRNNPTKVLSTTTQLTVKPNATDTFIVVVTQTSSGCADTAEYEIVVKNIPQLVISNVYPAREICSGSVVELTADFENETGVSGGEVYTWYRTVLGLSQETSNTIRENLYNLGQDSTVYIYTVQLRQAASGCLSTIARDTITVRRPAVVEIIALNNTTTICANDNLMLLANVDPDAANVPTTYQWYKDNLPIMVNGNDSIYIVHDTARATVYSYHVVINQLNGCSPKSNTLKIWIVEPINVNIAQTLDSICLGGEVAFTANVPNNPKGYTFNYEWQVNGVTQPENAATIKKSNFHVGVDNTVTVIVTPQAFDGMCAAVDTAYINVKNVPVVHLTNADTIQVCGGSQVQIIAELADSANKGLLGGESYRWEINGKVQPGTKGNILTDHPIVPVDEDSTFYRYTATVTQSASGCVSTVSNTVVAIAYKTPVPFIYTMEDTTVCKKHTGITLNANVVPVNANTQYKWYVNNEEVGADYDVATTAKCTLPNDLAVGTYKYYVEVYQYPGCKPVSNTITVTVVDSLQLQLTQSLNAICEGGTVRFEANVTPVDKGGMYDYTWTVDGKQLRDNSPVVMVSDSFASNPLTATTNDVKVVVTPRYGNGLCSEEKTVQVTVNPVPLVVLNTPTDTQVCSGGEVRLKATTTGGVNDGEVYTWYENGNLIPNNFMDTIKVYPVVMGNNDSTVYYYTATVKQTANGCVSLMSTSKRVVAYKTPVPFIYTMEDTTVCKKHTGITLNANVVPGNTNTQYKWYVNNKEVGTDYDVATTPKCTLPNDLAVGTYKYYVEVYQYPGCKPTSNTITVTVVDSLTLQLTQSLNAICKGGEVRFEANVTPVDKGGMYDYTWTVDGKQLKDNSPVVMVSDSFASDPLTATTNDVKVVVTPRYGNGLCSEEKTVQVTVNPVPLVELNTPTDTQVCSGGEVRLKASVKSGGVSGGEVYTWYENGNLIPNNFMDSIKVYPVVVGNNDSTIYYYTATVKQTVNGCVSLMSASKRVVAYPTPAVAIAVSGYNTTICANDSVDLTANVIPNLTSGSGKTRYQWYKDGQLLVNDTNVTYRVRGANNAGTHNFTVKVRQYPGCEPESAPVAITVVPAIAVTVTADKDSICPGGTITLSASVVNGQPNAAYSYVWETTISGVVTTIGSTPTITLPNHLTAGEYTITAKVSPNYGSTATICDATGTRKIKIVADPVVSVSADVKKLCEGGYVELTASLSSNHPFYSTGVPVYTWLENGAQISGTTYKVKHYINDAGAYKYSAQLVLMNNPYGCVAKDSLTDSVTVIPQPIVMISEDSSWFDLCVGGKIHLTAEITNYDTLYGQLAKTPVDYKWYSNKNAYETMTKGADTSHYATAINRASTYNYYVTVTPDPKGRGCKLQESNVITYNVVNTPTWAKVDVTPQRICEGEEVNLTAIVQGGVRDASGNANGIIQWQKADASKIFADLKGVGGEKKDYPLENTYYRPTYTTNHFGDGCTLKEGDTILVTVNAKPKVDTMLISNDAGDYNAADTLCGNNVNSIRKLKITFTGEAPFTFELQETSKDGTISHNYVSNSKEFIMQVAPNKTTYYKVTMLRDGNRCDAEDDMITATVWLYVTDITDITTAITCGDTAVNGIAQKAKVYFNIKSTVMDGQPPVVTIHYVSGVLADITTIPITVEGELNYVEFETPTAPGDYQMELIINGCRFPFTLKVLVGNAAAQPLVLQRWDDVVVVNNNPANNGGYTFVSFQWYKDGVLIPGATDQYYQEIGGLSGNYSVMLGYRDAKGNMVYIMTCDKYFATKAVMRVMPNPAQTFQTVTIQAGLTDEELDGAVLDVYTVLGQHLRHIEIKSNTIKIEGFAVPGSYVGKITTGTQEIKSVKIVIVN